MYKLIKENNRIKICYNDVWTFDYLKFNHLMRYFELSNLDTIEKYNMNFYPETSLYGYVYFLSLEDGEKFVKDFLMPVTIAYMLDNNKDLKDIL